jgi:hypothetical protein
LVVTTYTIHLPQDSSSSKSKQGLNIGPTHSPGRREAAELSTKILDQFLEFISQILEDLKEHPAEPYLEQGTRINTSLKELQELLSQRPDVGPRVNTQQRQGLIPTRTKRIEQVPRVAPGRETKEATSPAP